MPTCDRLSLVSGACFAGLFGALVLGSPCPQAPAAGQEEVGFTPVVPAASIQHALETNLTIVKDWLQDKDFASAGQSIQGLQLLAQLYEYQSDQTAWRDRIKTLREALTRLQAAARNKNAASSEKAVQEITNLLAETAKAAPAGEKKNFKDFKAFGTTKAWMLLMDGAYVDAKTSKDAAEIEHLANAIAEESSAVKHLRKDARWQKWSQEVQVAALQTAKKARDKDVEGARKDLKIIYERCEACHQGTRR